MIRDWDYAKILPFLFQFRRWKMWPGIEKIQLHQWRQMLYRFVFVAMSLSLFLYCMTRERITVIVCSVYFQFKLVIWNKKTKIAFWVHRLNYYMYLVFLVLLVYHSSLLLIYIKYFAWVRTILQMKFCSFFNFYIPFLLHLF